MKSIQEIVARVVRVKRSLARGLGYAVLALSVSLLGLSGCAPAAAKRAGSHKGPLQIVHIDSSSPDYVLVRNAGSLTLDLRGYKFVEDKNVYAPDAKSGQRVLIEPGMTRRIYFLSRKNSVALRTEWINWISENFPNALVCVEFGLSSGERLEVWDVIKDERIMAVRVP